MESPGETNSSKLAPQGTPFTLDVTPDPSFSGAEAQTARPVVQSPASKEEMGNGESLELTKQDH